MNPRKLIRTKKMNSQYNKPVVAQNTFNTVGSKIIRLQVCGEYEYLKVFVNYFAGKYQMNWYLL